jgi:hypothetical protein
MPLTSVKRGLVILLIPIIFLTFRLSAQDSLRTLSASRINAKVKIDGVLDDQAWLETTPFEGNFYQLSPDNGANSEYKSKIYVIYDNRAMYVGALLYDPDPQTIPQELGERDDNDVNADVFAIIVDPLNQGQNGFLYAVTAAGVQGDAVISTRDDDDDWNAVWNSEVKITDEGWVVEMEIPYSAIRFPKVEKPIWGLNFYRASKRLNEEAMWNFVDQEVEGFINQSGEMHGLKDITPPLRLSFLPYLSVGGQYDSETKGFSRSIAGGMDMKLGISESFTLDISLVPDFSQVQSDNVVLNLSPFEVRYDENRPFFTEGIELFSKGRIFYSRRIGQVRGDVDEDDMLPSEEITEFPATAQLINATKLSGRTAKGTGLGFFNAITKNTYATIKDTLEGGGSRDYLVDPLTNFNVVVFDQNLKNNSSIGLINTNVMRAGHYRDANVTLMDFRFRDRSNTWSLSGSNGLSQIFTNEEYQAINTQGFKSRLFFSKVSGKFQFSTGATIESDEWDINDLGFMRQNNRINYSTHLSYNIYKPFSVFNRMGGNIRFNYEQLYKPNTYVEAELGGNFNAEFKSFHSISIGFNVRPFDNYDYYEPRHDGYFFKTSGNYNFSVFYRTDRRKKFNVGMHSGMWNRPEDGAKMFFGGLGPSYRVSNRMNFDYELNLNIGRNTKGYVTTEYDDQDEITAVIFGHRDQNTITNTVGLKYTFTNKMGLTFRMRHYWSWVDYDKFYDLDKSTGELKDSNYTGLDENGYPENNTTFNAFNIDMVYSWQVAPGSFFTAVWKNQIYSGEDYAQKNFSENMNDTFNANGTNTLTLKLVYFIDIAYFKKKEL